MITFLFFQDKAFREDIERHDSNATHSFKIREIPVGQILRENNFCKIKI